MHRLLVGTCVLALAVFAVQAAEDKNEKNSVKDTFTAMFKELVGKYKEAADQKKEAKSEKAKAKIQKEIDGLIVSYAEKFVDLVKKNPKDEFAFPILARTLSLPLPDGKDSPKSKAIELLKKDHVKSPKLAVVLQNLGNSDDPETASFVKAVFDENPDKKVHLAAFKAYMSIQEQIIAADKDAKSVAKAMKELEENRKLLKTEFKGEIKDLYVGATMPELTSKNLEDKEVKLSDLKGKVVVLDIWATWCPPCRAMIPHSRELVKKLKDKPFVLVSISADEMKETLTDFMKDNEMPWTHWWTGKNGSIIRALDVGYYPTIYVLDGKGVIRAKDVREEAMDKVVEKLLKEMEDAKKAKTE